MCRLGYLKIVCSLVNEFQPYSREVLAETLERVVTTKDGKALAWNFPPGLSTTALIPAATAVNYVEFSSKLRIVNSNNYTLDNRGRILRHLIKSENDSQSIISDSSKNPLILAPHERLFFFIALLEEDGLALFPLLEYLTETKEVSRREAMIYFMEKIYENALTDYLPSVNEEKKYKIKEEIEKAKKFRSNRLSNKKIQDWISTDTYALYRHAANPRIEWLVDVGFLQKKPDSSFKVTSEGSKLNDIVRTTSSISDLYSKLAEIIFTNTKESSEEQIMALIVESYNKFTKAGYLSVNVDILTTVVLLEGLRRDNRISSYSRIKGILNDIPKKFPRNARFHYDLQGRPTLIKMDTKDITAR